MPNYHCSVKVISRANGRSSVAAAAYRAGATLTCERDGLTHDYTRKHGVTHSEISLPDDAPDRWYDREILWNEVESTERSAKAQLAREFEVSLPRELSSEDQIELTRSFVHDSLVERGMCADWSIHDKDDGNPHAHILTTMRSCDSEGFLAKSYGVYLCRDNQGNDNWLTPSELQQKEHEGYEKCYSYNKEYLTKNEAIERRLDPIQDRDRKQPIQETRYYNDWNDKERVLEWRQEWEKAQNTALEKHYEQSLTPKQQQEYVDSRSYEKQGLDREPMRHEGPFVHKIEEQHKKECIKKGIEYKPITARRQENIEIQERNTLRERIAEKLLNMQQYIVQLREALMRRFNELSNRLEAAYSNIKQTVQHLPQEIDQAIEKVSQKPSGNYMKDLASECSKRGIKMSLNEDKSDLRFTTRIKNDRILNLSGKDIDRSLDSVIKHFNAVGQRFNAARLQEIGEKYIDKYIEEQNQVPDQTQDYEYQHDYSIHHEIGR